jgi:hypothetical protein
VKALDIVHGGLYSWKVVSFSQGLVRSYIRWLIPTSSNNLPTVN